MKKNYWSTASIEITDQIVDCSSFRFIWFHIQENKKRHWCQQRKNELRKLAIVRLLS